MSPSELEELTKDITRDYCPPKCKIIYGYHGTSLDRAKSIEKNGFMDSRRMKKEMLEGFSSQNYEGGLVFFGTDDYGGKKIASRHAMDRCKEEFFKANPTKNWENFNKEVDFPEMKKYGGIVQSKICACNHLRDRDVTESMISKVVEIANKKTKEVVAQGKKREDNPLFRYTYSRPSPNKAFDFIDNGVMTSFNINMSDIMHELGFDAIDGYEENVSIVLNNPKVNIMENKVFPLQEFLEKNKIKEYM